MTCATYETEKGDLVSEKKDEMLKDAGRFLYEFDGMRGMHDNLVWAFVPTRYRKILIVYEMVLVSTLLSCQAYNILHIYQVSAQSILV